MLWIPRILLSPLTLLRLLLIVLNAILSFGILKIEDAISKKTGKFTFFTAQYWGKSTLFLMGVFVKHNKRPPINNYMVMPNHRSYLDILIMAAYSPSAFVAKVEVLKWPVLGSAVKIGRAILVKRDEMKSLIATMKKIKTSIDNGMPVTIFPEGTTFKGPGVKPFKNGSFKIAAENTLPVVPCAIEYRDPGLRWVSTESFIQNYVKMFWKPYSIAYLQFGNPIQENDFKILKEKTKDSILIMLQEIHQKL